MIRAILSGGRYMIDIDKEGALISHPKTRGASIKPDAGDEPCHAPAHFIARLNLWSQSGDLRQPLGPANVLQ